MAISIILEKHEPKMVSICDYCGKKIMRPADANFEWNESPDLKRIIDGKIFHIRHCNSQYEKHGGDLECSTVMTNLISDWLSELKVDDGGFS